MFVLNGAGATVVSYYIDIGTSSYVIQMALAVGLGGLVALLMWRRRLMVLVKTMFSKIRGENEPRKRSKKH